MAIEKIEVKNKNLHGGLSSNHESTVSATILVSAVLTNALSFDFSVGS